MRGGGIGVLVVAGALATGVASCICFPWGAGSSPLDDLRPGFTPPKGGAIAVVLGDPGPVAVRAAETIDNTLRRDHLRVVARKVVAKARHAFPDEIPLSTTGQYMDKVLHPERANPGLATQLLRTTHAEFAYIVWSPPLLTISGAIQEARIVGQLYVMGPTGAYLLAYSDYRFRVDSDWPDTRVDATVDDAATDVAHAVEARLGDQ